MVDSFARNCHFFPLQVILEDAVDPVVSLHNVSKQVSLAVVTTVGIVIPT